MKTRDKLNLLSKGLWSRKEYMAYFDLTKWKATYYSKKMKNKPTFRGYVFRDEALKVILNTTKEDEVNFLKTIL